MLDRLKHHPATRHIPVHIVSGGDGRQQSLRAGRSRTSQKPVTRESLADAFGSIANWIDRGARHLLVVEDDEEQRQAIVELVGGDDVDVVAVGPSEEALAALEEKTFDCMVLDLKLPGKGGYELLERVKKSERHRDLPVIVYTGKELTRQEETRLASTPRRSSSRTRARRSGCSTRRRSSCTGSRRSCRPSAGDARAAAQRRRRLRGGRC